MYHMKIQMQKFLTHLLYVHVCTIYLFILMIHSYLENKKNWGGGEVLEMIDLQLRCC